MTGRKFAATPRETNALLVGVEDSGNIIVVRPDGRGGERWRHTITDVDGLIAALRDAKINVVILEDLHR